MSKNKPIGERLRNYLSNAYNDFNKDEKKYRCKIRTSASCAVEKRDRMSVSFCSKKKSQSVSEGIERVCVPFVLCARFENRARDAWRETTQRMRQPRRRRSLLRSSERLVDRFADECQCDRTGTLRLSE